MVDLPRIFLIPAFALGFASLSVEAWADSTAPVTGEGPRAADVKEAAERFDRGREAFKEQRYVEAAEHFEAADSRAPSPVTLGLAIRCRLEGGQLAKSATLAAYALERYPNEPALVAESRKVLEQAEQSVGWIELSCAPPCEPLLDGRIVHGRPEGSWRLFAEGGRREVTASWPGRPSRTATLEVVAGEATTLRLSPPTDPSLDPAVVPPAEEQTSATAPAPTWDTAPRRSGKWSPVPFWVGVAVTGVTGALTVWSGVDTANNPGADAVREGCVGQGQSCSLYEEGQSKELRTNLLLGATAVFALATTVIGAFATDFGGNGGETPTVDATVRPRAPAARRTGFALEPWLSTGPSLESGGRERYDLLVGTRGRF